MALGVAATGIAGALSAVCVGTSVCRDAVASTQAVNVGRTILASPELLANDPRELYADAAGLHLSDSPFSDAVFVIRIDRCVDNACRDTIPVCVSISWERGGGRVRFMAAIPRLEKGAVP